MPWICTDHVTWLCPVGQEQRQHTRTWKETWACSQRWALRLSLEPSHHVNKPGPVGWRVRDYANRGLSQPSCRDQEAITNQLVLPIHQRQCRRMNKPKIHEQSQAGPGEPPTRPRLECLRETGLNHFLIKCIEKVVQGKGSRTFSEADCLGLNLKHSDVAMLPATSFFSVSVLHCHMTNHPTIQWLHQQPLVWLMIL